jgi:hypothetical protein
MPSLSFTEVQVDYRTADLNATSPNDGNIPTGYMKSSLSRCPAIETARTAHRCRQIRRAGMCLHPARVEFLQSVSI